MKNIYQNMKNEKFLSLSELLVFMQVNNKSRYLSFSSLNFKNKIVKILLIRLKSQ